MVNEDIVSKQPVAIKSENEVAKNEKENIEQENIDQENSRSCSDWKGRPRAYQPSFIRDPKRSAKSNFSTRKGRSLVSCPIEGCEFKFQWSNDILNTLPKEKDGEPNFNCKWNENTCGYRKILKSDGTHRWKSNPLKGPKRSIQSHHANFFFLYENKNLNFKSISDVVLSAHKDIPVCAAINSQHYKRKGVQNSMNGQLEKGKGGLINPNFIQQGNGKGPTNRGETGSLVPNRSNAKLPYCFTPQNINPHLDERRRSDTKNFQFENTFLRAALNGMLQNPFSQPSYAFSKTNNANPMSSLSHYPMSGMQMPPMSGMQMPTFYSDANQGNPGLQQYLEMEEMNAISRLPQNSEHRNNIAAIELHLIAEEKQKIEQLTQYLQMVKPAENFPHTNPVQNRPAWNNQNLIQQLMLTRAMDGSLPKM